MSVSPSSVTPECPKHESLPSNQPWKTSARWIDHSVTNEEIIHQTSDHACNMSSTANNPSLHGSVTNHSTTKGKVNCVNYQNVLKTPLRACRCWTCKVESLHRHHHCSWAEDDKSIRHEMRLLFACGPKQHADCFCSIATKHTTTTTPICLVVQHKV